MFMLECFTAEGYKPRVDEEGNLVICPSLNKQATYLSTYVDAIEQVRNGTKLRVPVKSLFKTLELVLGVVFCNCARLYRSVLLDHWKARLPAGNLTQCRLQDGVRIHGCLSTGHDNRSGPLFNHNITAQRIHTGLQQLLQVVQFCNKLNTRTQYHTCSKMLT